jgi:hypothetical protein
MKETLAILRELRTVVDRVDQALHDVSEAVAEIREGGDDE